METKPDKNQSEPQKGPVTEFVDFCKDHLTYIGPLVLPVLVDPFWHDPTVFIASTVAGFVLPDKAAKDFEKRQAHIDGLSLPKDDDKASEKPVTGTILPSGTQLQKPSPMDRFRNWMERNPDITAYATGIIVGSAFQQPGIGLVVSSLALQAYKISPAGRQHSVEAEAEYHENLAAEELSKGTELPNLASWHERRARNEIERAAKVRHHKVEAYYPY